MSAWISLLMFIHKVFILRYAVETVIGSVRKHSLFVDINSSVSNICLLHLFVVAFCIQKTIRFRTLFFLMEKKDYKNINNKFNSTDITRQGFDRQFGTKISKRKYRFPYACFDARENCKWIEILSEKVVIHT